MYRKQTRLWTTANGERIRICDMGITHLLNAIRSKYNYYAKWAQPELSARNDDEYMSLLAEAYRRGFYAPHSEDIIDLMGLPEGYTDKDFARLERWARKRKDNQL